MDQEQFSLCWNNFHNNLTSGFQALLKDEDLVDVTLSAEGRHVKAHKIVLSVCSPYFKELFRENPCDHPIVILHDVNYNALSNLLQFMYNGEVSVNQDEIPTFMRVAEVLKIKGLTENTNLTSTSSNETNINNGFSNSSYNTSQSSADQQSIVKREKPKPIKKIVKPMRNSPTGFSPSPSLQSSTPQPPAKIPRLENEENFNKPQHDYMEPLIQPKLEPIDPLEDDEYRESPGGYFDHPNDMSAMLETSLQEPGETSMSFNDVKDVKMKMDSLSTPGTLQCILGKRGLPRLIVDGYTFFKKSTYKNKCFWYCKTNRIFKCPAVCWTVNGRIVKWPDNHSHEIVPEIITPGEDTIVPIEMLRQVLIDCAR